MSMRPSFQFSATNARSVPMHRSLGSVAPHCLATLCSICALSESMRSAGWMGLTTEDRHPFTELITDIENALDLTTTNPALPPGPV
jgi:hypothetical protein